MNTPQNVNRMIGELVGKGITYITNHPTNEKMLKSRRFTIEVIERIFFSVKNSSHAFTAAVIDKDNGNTKTFRTLLLNNIA